MTKTARTIVIIALMTACLTVVKQVLAFIPNVEGVSLLIAVFSATFGYLSIISSILFVVIECFIWGFNTWVIGYFIYWPLLSIVFCLLSKGKLNTLSATITIVVMTFLFGVITSLVEVGLFSGSYDDFFTRFFIYYGRGIVFYIVHIVSNAIVFALLFDRLRNFAIKLNNKRT